MCNKICYSQKDAGSLVNLFHSRRKSDNRRKFCYAHKALMRSYFCKECGAYHVTSLKHFKED